MRIKIKATVEIDLSAKEWGLFVYDASISSPEVTEASSALNKGAAEAIDIGNDLISSGQHLIEAAKATWVHFLESAEPYSKYGATDDEPKLIFEHLMNAGLVARPFQVNQFIPNKPITY